MNKPLKNSLNEIVQNGFQAEKFCPNLYKKGVA